MNALPLSLLMIVAGVPALSRTAERPSCVDPDPSICSPDRLRLVLGELAGGETRLATEKGREFTAFVAIDVKSDKLQNWSYGVKQDPARLQLVEASHAFPENPLARDDYLFEATQLARGEPAPGFVVGVVPSETPPSRKFLPVGDNFPMCNARYQVMDKLAEDQAALLEFSEELKSRENGIVPDLPRTKVSLVIARLAPAGGVRWRGLQANPDGVVPSRRCQRRRRDGCSRCHFHPARPLHEPQQFRLARGCRCEQRWHGPA